MISGAGPLWLRAPARAAAEGPWALLLVAAFLLASVAGAADMLSVSAWRTASVVHVLDAVPEGELARSAPVLQVLGAPGPGWELSRLRREVDEVPGMTPAVLLGTSFRDELDGSAFVRFDSFAASGGRRVPARLVAAGDPGALLRPAGPDDGSVAGTDLPALWLPAPLAAELVLEPGDTFQVGISSTAGEGTEEAVDAVLAGRYTVAADGRTPADAEGSSFWADRSARLPADPGGASGALFVVGETEVVGDVAADVGDVLLWSLDSGLEPGPPPTRDELGGTVAGVTAVQRYLGGADLAGAGGAVATSLVTGLPGLAEAADDITRAAAAEARTPAVGAIVLGLVVVLAISALTAVRRERELELLAGLGMRPPAVGLLGLLEVLPAAVIGWAVGVPVTVLGVRALTGVDPEAAALPPALVQSGVVVLAGVAVHAVVTAVAATAAARRGARHARRQRALPWREVLVATAVAAVVGLLAAPVGDARGLDLAVPVLLSAAVGALGATALRRSAVPRTGGSAVPRRLTVRGAGGHVVRRRLGAAGGERLLVVTTLAAAFGLAAHVLVGEQLVERSVEDKVAVLAGADVVVEVDHPYQLDRDLLAEDLAEDQLPRDAQVPAGDSVVYRDSGTLQGRRQLDVVVVDPETLPAAASWGSGVGALQESRSALQELAAADVAATPTEPSVPARPEVLPPGAAAGGAAPVLVVGDAAGLRPGDRTSLASPNGDVPLEVVGLVPAFPGIDPDLRTGLVAATGSYLPRLPNGDPRFAPVAGPPTRLLDVDRVELWSSRALPAVTADLRGLGVGPEVLGNEQRVRTVSGVLTLPPFVAAGLVAPYLLALAGLVLLVAVLALCLTVDRAAVRARAGDVVLARVGLGRRGTRRLLVVEAAVLVAAGLVLGALGWLLGVPLLPRLLDPEPTVAPVLGVTPVPWAALPLLAAASLALLAGAAVAWSGSRARSEEEVLRAQD